MIAVESVCFPSRSNHRAHFQLDKYCYQPHHYGYSNTTPCSILFESSVTHPRPSNLLQLTRAGTKYCSPVYIFSVLSYVFIISWARRTDWNSGNLHINHENLDRTWTTRSPVNLGTGENDLEMLYFLADFPQLQLFIAVSPPFLKLPKDGS